MNYHVEFKLCCDRGGGFALIICLNDIVNYRVSVIPNDFNDRETQPPLEIGLSIRLVDTRPTVMLNRRHRVARKAVKDMSPAGTRWPATR